MSDQHPAREAVLALLAQGKAERDAALLDRIAELEAVLREAQFAVGAHDAGVVTKDGLIKALYSIARRSYELGVGEP